MSSKQQHSFKQIIFFLIFSFIVFSAFNTDSDLVINKNNLSNVVSSSITFSQAGPIGGGYPNVVTWDPNIPGKIYYGSDIGGTGRSTNYGKDFESAARGLGYEESHQKIAALNAVNVNGNTVIVGGTGFKGLGGEVISSVDGGNS